MGPIVCPHSSVRNGYYSLLNNPKIFLLIYFQRDATLYRSFISRKLLYMFGVVSPPIIRSTYNCIYSIRYLLTVTITFLYCRRVFVALSVVWELYPSVT